MKRIIQIVIPVLIIGALFLPFLRVEKDVDIQTLTTLLKGYVSDQMSVQDIKIVKSSYEIMESDMESYLSYGPISYINVDEITLIRQSDDEKRAMLYEKAQAHIQKQIKSFEGYGVEQTKLLKKAKVEERGNYVICIVSKQAEKISLAFNKAFE
ncbi:MAG: DUF4358 domain-containing protein [Erysipelotrichia bacterium]|nr:DUF4358 domain-containing protein [Erysipelotrichia bacterium]NCC54589.1 DUF4358 domain-containing protein [Erysipelotrichia bacterium]